MEQQTMDAILTKAISHDAQMGLDATAAQIQRSACLLETDHAALIHSTAKEQYLIAELMVRVRILYLFYNDDGIIDSLVDKIVETMK